MNNQEVKKTMCDNYQEDNSPEHVQKVVQPNCTSKICSTDSVIEDSTNKDLSADSVFKDLKKETFLKNDNVSSFGSFVEILSEPPWLNPSNRSSVHFLYDAIWSVAKLPPDGTDHELADTNVVSRLLMTSGLTTDMLGFIWNLANNTVPGSLTQPELYSVLALVALAQHGHVFNTLSVIYRFPEPPIPKLDLSVIIQLKPSVTSPSVINIEPTFPVKSPPLSSFFGSSTPFFSLNKIVSNSFLVPQTPLTEVPDSTSNNMFDVNNKGTQLSIAQKEDMPNSFNSWQDRVLETAVMISKGFSGVPRRRRKFGLGVVDTKPFPLRKRKRKPEKSGDELSKSDDLVQYDFKVSEAPDTALSYQAGPSSLRPLEDSLKVTVIPDNFPNCEISTEQSQLIEGALAQEFKILENGAFPQFTNSHIEAGAYVITCVNVETKKWVEETIPKLKPWIGAKLQTPDSNSLLRMTKVIFKTPITFLHFDPSKVLELLGNQNNGLNTSNWRVVSSNKNDPSGQILIVLIDDPSLQALRLFNMRAFLGLGRILINVYKQEDEVVSCEQNPPENGNPVIPSS